MVAVGVGVTVGVGVGVTVGVDVAAGVGVAVGVTVGVGVEVGVGVQGSYNSALARSLPPLLSPLATSTIPLGSSVAV
jgi:hypothetical protein